MEKKEKRLGAFEKYLAVWVALCMAAGIILSALASRPWHFRIQ